MAEREEVRGGVDNQLTTVLQAIKDMERNLSQLSPEDLWQSYQKFLKGSENKPDKQFLDKFHELLLRFVMKDFLPTRWNWEGYVEPHTIVIFDKSHSHELALRMDLSHFSGDFPGLYEGELINHIKKFSWVIIRNGSLVIDLNLYFSQREGLDGHPAKETRDDIKEALL